MAHLVRQDLSVAGKRAGLDGARSGLFMEQIRVIKEMRNEFTEQLRVRGANVDRRLVKPRFMVWENVPGAFSSNKGEDFRCVLEETAKIVCEDAVIPRPTNGKWTPSGAIMGDGWSIAWRVHDAQFWGVPQRRKRISLVADFGGQSAPEILFISKGLSGDSEPSREEGQDVTSDTERGTNPASYTLKIRGGAERDSSGKKAGKGPLVQTELSATLGVSQDQTLICLEGNGSRESHRGDGYIESDTMYTLNTVEHHGVAYGLGLYNQTATGNVSKTLNSIRSDSDHVPCVAYGLDRASFNQGQNAKFDFSVDEEVAPPIVAKGPGGVMQRLSEHCVQEITKE